MFSRRSSDASRLSSLSSLSRRLFVRGWRRRLLCLLLIAGLLMVPDAGYAVRAATDAAVQVAKDTVAPVPVAYSWFKRLFRRSAKPRQRETSADRSAAVHRIAITPGKIVGYTGQQLSFSAIGSNADGQIIQGVQFNWSSSDAEKLQIDGSGMATLKAPGLVWVSVTTSNASARVPVLVKPGARPAQSDDEWQADQSQLQPDGTVGTTQSGVGALLNSMGEGLMPTAHAQSGGGDSADFGYDELWSEPRNWASSPRNGAMTATNIGAVLPEGSKFEFSVPIYGLSGRGLSESLAMNYNSRIWTRHGSAVTFNAVNSWPYIGFTLSFGRILTYTSGTNTKFVLIDSDGTRHYLGSGPGGTTATYQSNDGSHITYVGNATTGGALYYNSGVKKAVVLTNNRLLVTSVTDPNGNYITVSYASQPAPCGSGGNGGAQGFVWKQAISTVTDTLGRVITFNYDSCNNLVSIDVPGYLGTSTTPVTTTIARFDYQTGTASSSFSGLTVENMPSQAVGMSHVYFPATNTGYKFTYSAYGMITKVSRRNGMSYNATTGAIADGTEQAYCSFNYPTSAGSLTDAPSFSQWTQFPTTPGASSTWSVAAGSGSGTKIYTFTNPDSTSLVLTRSDTAGTDFGLLTQSEVKSVAGTTWAKSLLSYTTDGGGQPQIANVIGYDDGTPTPNQTKVDYDYDSYGNMTNLREYGYQVSGSWAARRRTHMVYQTGSSYVNAYLRSLPTETDVYDAQLDTNDANDVLMAKTTYTYDNYAALGGMDDYGGTATSYSVGHLTSYDTTKTVRGNVTAVTDYTDVSAPTYITHYKQIDIFGNVVTEQLTCCNQAVVNTDSTNGYAMPTTVVKGDPSGTTLTTTYDPDYNTGLQKKVTNPEGLDTTVVSRDAALRPTQIDLPSLVSASVTNSYNDSTLTTTQSVSYDAGGTTKTITATTVTDGRGRTIQKTDNNGGQVNTQYDSQGRVASVSNPFTAGGTPSYWTSMGYDALGRVTTMTMPDTQTVTTSYNGNTTTVTDQVNRKMEQVMDGLGRRVTVYEQDSSGGLTQATNYTYDILGNLIQSDQGGQLRQYKYDALGRQLYGKIPEQTASINDGTGTLWTSKYTYNDSSLVVTSTDARGVVATNSYDTLNRLTQTSYSTVSGVTTAPTVTYTYDSDATYGTTATGNLLRVNVGTDYQERYTFDPEFRLASAIRTIGSRSYTTSYNSYNDANQLTQVTYPSGQALYTRYDSSGRLSGLTNYALGDLGNGHIDFLSGVAYDVAGHLTGDTLGNGVTEQFGYDAQRLQMTSQNAGTTSPYTNRLNLTYGYSATTGQMGVGSTAGNAGPLMSVSGTINGATESASYTYDNYKRLVTSNQTSNGSSAQRRFAYDRWGNRTGVWDATTGGTQIQSVSLVTSGSIPTNQISSVTTSSTVSYTYDANGNVTNDGVHSYTYDSANRLVSVDSGTTASYAYDHQNRRYKKTVGSTVTHYVWQGDQVLSEHNGSTGASLVDYIQAGSRLVAKNAAGTWSYALSDRLSARLTMNTSGTVTGQQGHLPFGEDFAETSTQQKQHFTSYERDSETGTDYAVNRQYNEGIGRFNRVDPASASYDLGYPQSMNRYTYTTNDPINRTDPTGLYWTTICAINWPKPPLEPADPYGPARTTCAPVWVPDGTNPTGTGSGPGGNPLKNQLANALTHLGPGCTDFFGGKDTLKQRSDEVLNDTGSDEIKFIAQGGAGWNDTIPGAPSGFGGSLLNPTTYKKFWHADEGSDYENTVAQVVNFTEPYLPPQNFNTMILGNQFFKGPSSHTSLWTSLPQENRLGAWQDMILIHEYMHILNNTGDQGLVDSWAEKGANLPEDSDPSIRVSKFIEQDCPHKNWKQ